ncbi:MAG: hypothetical protein OEY56_04735 [Cyclobacteriaceae bacterium]|nr:hypothetical protein [Cyclobacteriaceae bacterium]
MRQFSLIFSALALTFLLSCTDTDPVAESPVSDDQTAELVGSTLSSGGYGLNATARDASLVANMTLGFTAGGRQMVCGTQIDSTFTFTSPAGALYSYQYQMTYTLGIACNSLNIPTALTVTLASTGNFSGQRWSSENSGSANLEYTGLLPTQAVYVLNGEYERHGTFMSHVGAMDTLQSSITVTLTNVEIDKATQMISSGTGTVTVEGTTGLGEAFSRQAAITFEGNGMATLTIATSVYSLNLQTGDVTK